MASSDGLFRQLAESKGLKEATTDALIAEEIDSVDIVATLTAENINALRLSIGQTNLLTAWVTEVKHGFHNNKVANRVLAHGDLKLENANLVVTCATPLRQQSQLTHVDAIPKPAFVHKKDEGDVMIVHGISGLSRDTVEMFFESKKKCDGDDINKIDFDENGNSAVITYENPTVAGRVLARGPTFSLSSKTLTVTRPPKPDPCSIMVQNIQRSTSTDTLTMFFESKKRSAGGYIADIQYVEGCGSAIITFKDAEVATRVLAHAEMMLENAKLCVTSAPAKEALSLAQQRQPADVRPKDVPVKVSSLKPEEDTTRGQRQRMTLPLGNSSVSLEYNRGYNENIGKQPQASQLNTDDQTHYTKPSMSVEDSRKKVYIGITGRSGVGKSSLINTLKNLSPGDKYAAKVGIVETTMAPRAYLHPNLSNVVFWDMPGFNTKTFQREHYIDSMKLINYDFLVICSSGHFTQDEIWILDEARKLNIPFYFVRTKLDLDINNDKQDHPDTHDENTVISTVQSKVETSLRNAGMVTDKIFFISTKLQLRSKWDFPRLVEELIDNTPGTQPLASQVNTDGQRHYSKLHQASPENVHPSTSVGESNKKANKFIKNNGIEKIGDKLDEHRKHPVHIGITGRCGVGKSSLINTLRNLRPWDAGAAKRGYMETTMAPVAVYHPHLPKVVFWEMPGFKTKTSRRDYDNAMNQMNYDALIICTSWRFTQVDLWLSDEAMKFNIPLYFVHTKIDLDIKNDKEDHPDTHDENVVIESVRSQLKDNLTKARLNTDMIFLISTNLRFSSKWDFPRLVDILIENTPDKNQQALIFALISSSTNAIKRKREELFTRIPSVIKHISLETKAEEVASILKEEICFYEKQFGFTKENLVKVGISLCDRHDLITSLSNYNTGFGIVGGDVGVASIGIGVLAAIPVMPLTVIPSVTQAVTSLGQQMYQRKKNGLRMASTRILEDTLYKYEVTANNILLQ